MSETSQEIEDRPGIEEKPLSPIFRKKLIKRNTHKKSRINLTDKFSTSSSNKSSKTGTNEANEFADEILSVSQAEILFADVEKLDRHEKYATESTTYKTSIFHQSNSATELASKGFQTARGRAIDVSEANEQNSLKLFSDILNTSCNQGFSRTKKCNFLSKSKPQTNYSNLDQLENNPTNSEFRQVKGFERASGKNFNISHSHLKKAQNIFLNITENCSQLGITDLEGNSNTLLSSASSESQGFKRASGKTINLPQSSLKKAKIMFFDTINDNTFKNQIEPEQTLKDSNKCTFLEFTGFKRASGNNISISPSSLKKAESLLPDSIDDCKLKQNNKGVIKSLFQLPNKFDEKTPVFLKASGENVNISNAAMKKAGDIVLTPIEYEECTIGVENNSDNTDKADTFKGFSEASEEYSYEKQFEFSLLVKEIERTKHMNKFHGKRLPPNSDDHIKILKKRKICDNQISWTNHHNDEHATQRSNIPPQSLISTNNTNNVFKTSSGTFLKIADNSLSRAKSLFHDNVSSPLSNNDKERNNTLSTKPRIKKRLGVSSARKTIQLSKESMEKASKIVLEGEKSPAAFKVLKEQSFASTPIKANTTNASTPLKSHSFFDSSITPIKKDNVEESENCLLLNEPTPGNIDVWIKNLNQERRRIEEQLKAQLNLISKRQELLEKQHNLLKTADSEYKKKRNGVLFNQKQSNFKVSLRDYLICDFSSPRTVENINAQNAELIHFKCPNFTLDPILTLDGAIIIPNHQNIIGLSEIETGFKVLPGVDPRLIPQGWIRNHFKWIVWKLASYERFASNMKNSLNIENIIQQLKYRYDREIDRAERPALRKIFELDDVPQRRMVLCVSKIFFLPENKCELELTDGWYSIKAEFDDALSELIIRDKIIVGTKIITCSAELLNCQGCHPLSASDIVRLKISCNSTRKAAWYAKLGYQQNPRPFPVLLKTIKSKGGLISCIKIYVARVYPVKYLEKQGKITVWRNKKAEERRTSDWENVRLKKIQEIQELVQKDYEKSLSSEQNKSHSNNFLNKNEISKITCAETLYGLYLKCRDPESLMEMLSNEQRDAIMEYQRNINLSREKEISSRIQDGVNKLQICNRDVTPVLKMQVVDALSNSDEKTAILEIWKPSEFHIQMIKEGAVFYVYNVLPKPHGGLSSTNKTSFKAHFENITKFGKFSRTYLPIKSICDNYNNMLFNEFDTAGIVIRIVIYTFEQHLLLADAQGSLLFVKIFEGAKNCLLLDNIKTGQVVSASNLISTRSKFDFAEATANICSIISLYPPNKHLKDAIASLEADLPQDMDAFIDECCKKLEYLLENPNNSKSQNESASGSKMSNIGWDSTLNDSEDDDTLTFSRITSTDIAMSLIDVDKLFSDVN